jgi:poly(hydroxyalkanoate) depolymerase family esterase
VQPLSFARRPPTRASLALAVVLAALTAFLVATGSGQRAQAAGSLTQISNFGSNPGALKMYDYVPASAQPNAPLVIALHGCTQQASDYYNDSGWPKYAELWGFDLVFPQQTSANNSLECFDWFTGSDDTRGNGEAASIVQMVQYMQAHYSIDAYRIYITGLSAGGGMTADLLADYPDVFRGRLGRLGTARAVRDRWLQQRVHLPERCSEQDGRAVGRAGDQLRSRLRRTLAARRDLAGNERLHGQHGELHRADGPMDRRLGYEPDTVVYRSATRRYQRERLQRRER